MKVSIITVCFNSEATIRNTIESVLGQTYLNIEYIIVDGGSTDSTLSIIDEYKENINQLVSEPDKGIYDAINKGIKLANGDFVGLLNSDDLLYSKKCIQIMCEYIKENSSVDALYADLIYVKRDDINKKTRNYSLKNFSLSKARFGFMIPHPTFYAKPEIFKKHGLYKEDYRVAADFELMLRFKKNNVSISRIPTIMVKMREGGISSTGFWWMIHQNLEIVKACKENNIYTNILFISFKLPFKIASRLFK